MSKSITIAEGTQSKNFNNVHKIRTNLIGGGNQYWVPEDEAGDYANLSEKSINANGTYDAADENKDGFSRVIVNVSPNLTTKTITENGSYSASGDGAQGYSRVDVNVSGGNLITKEITQNGIYNASDDNAGGYSSVTVNVSTPRARNLYNGIENAPVNSRISTEQFYSALKSNVGGLVYSIFPSEADMARRERIYSHLDNWLTDTTALDEERVVLVGGGGIRANEFIIWAWAVGILDETGDISFNNITGNTFTVSTLNGEKLTAFTLTGYYMGINTTGRGATVSNSSWGVVDGWLRNQTPGESGRRATDVFNQGGTTSIPVITNLIGGTYV